MRERRGGPRAARAQESQGPEQRQPHGRGAPGRARAAGAGPRVEEQPWPRPTPAPHSTATRPRPACGPAPPLPRPRPAAQHRLFPAAAGIRVDRTGLEPSFLLRCPPASGLWPGFMRVVRAGTSGLPSPRSPPSASRRSVHHTLLNKKADGIPSFAVDGVVVAVAVGGGRKLLAGRAHRTPLSHVVPARPAVHRLAVQRGAHVGLGRLRCLAHYAAPTQQAAQERAPAV